MRPGSAVADLLRAFAFIEHCNIYKNRLGQIVLDPVKAVPVHEAWLFEDKNALASVKRGLADSSSGRTKYLGSFSAHAGEE